MNATPPPNPQTYVGNVNSFAAANMIDDPANLKTSQVYLFSGIYDDTVHPPVMTALEQFYQNFVPNVVFESTWPAAHTFPTDNAANTEQCSVSQSPYISYCKYDGAGIAMQQVYKGNSRGDRSEGLKPKNTGEPMGKVIAFNQNEFGDMSSISMGDTGYIYVPDNCANGHECAIILALHGCAQYVEKVGMDFVTNTGFNEWADTNDFVRGFFFFFSTARLFFCPSPFFFLLPNFIAFLFFLLFFSLLYYDRLCCILKLLPVR